MTQLSCTGEDWRWEHTSDISSLEDCNVCWGNGEVAYHLNHTYTECTSILPNYYVPLDHQLKIRTLRFSTTDQQILFFSISKVFKSSDELVIPCVRRLSSIQYSDCTSTQPLSSHLTLQHSLYMDSTTTNRLEKKIAGQRRKWNTTPELLSTIPDNKDLLKILVYVVHLLNMISILTGKILPTVPSFFQD